MQFFILFIVGAVIIGAGAMLSPAWPSAQPRVGLASAFALALVVGGAVFWANLFGWQTLVIDYLLFALVSIVILGGTMAQAQTRAEARGEELLDRDMGWPGPEDLAFLGLVIVLCALPLARFDFPVGRDAAGDAMITLAARTGGTFDSLLPFHPEITGIVAPGFYALAAYLSQQLHQPIPLIHMAIGAVVAFLCVWTTYDLGAEIQDKRLGRAMALALLMSLGVLRLYWDSHFSDLMGVLFALAFSTYALRAIRHHLPLDMVAAGLMLGAVLYVSPGMFMLTLAGYLVLLLASNIPPDSVEKGIPPAPPTILNILGLWKGVPLVAFLGTAPWLFTHWDGIERLLSNWNFQYQVFAESSFQDLLLVQGFWMIPVVIWGILISWRADRRIALWGLGSLALSFALYPPKASIIQSVAAPLPNPAQAQALAPLIPYALFGGFALLRFYDNFPQSLRVFLHRYRYLWAGLGLISLIGLFQLSNLWLGTDYPQSIAPDDLAAMRWLEENTAEDARIFNHPDALWASSTIGRETAFIAVPEGFFAPDFPVSSELAEYWQAPQGAISPGFEYILVPQWAEDPFAGSTALEVVFQQGAAVVYQARQAE